MVLVRSTQQAAPAYALTADEDPDRGEGTKGGGRGESRRVPLTLAASEEVRAHLRTHTGPDPHDPLIPQPSGRNAGKPVRRQTLAKWYRRALADALSATEREHLITRPHGLRHAAISHWLRSYVPVTTARRWSGHKSAKVLLDTYWGALPDDDEHDVAKLD